MSEKDFQQAVIDYAHLNGWLAMHQYDSRRTVAGWPDLVLLHPATSSRDADLMFVELKSAKGRVSAAQMRWLTALRQAGQEVAVWSPDQWDSIVARLRWRTRRSAA